MDPEPAHEPSCPCDKSDCRARQDLQSKADWLGIPFAHAEEIEHTLQYTSEILPDAAELRVSASILLKLIPILQAEKDLNLDTHALLVDCCKFHSVMVRHISTQSEGISPLAEAAMRTITHTLTVLYAMFSKTLNRKLWNTLISAGGRRNSVRELREKLRAAWKDTYPEMASVAHLLDAPPGDSMSEQMDMMIEKMIIIVRDGAHHGEYEFLKDFESDFNDSPFYTPPGLDPRATEKNDGNGDVETLSFLNDLRLDGHGEAQEGESTAHETYTLSNPVLEYQSASELQPFFGVSANITPFSRENIRLSDPN